VDTQADATGSEPAAGAQLGLEIRCVNSRFLDLSLRLPEDLRQLEPALRDAVGAQLKRGKVELRVSLESTHSGGVAEPSDKLLQRLVHDRLRSKPRYSSPRTPRGEGNFRASLQYDRIRECAAQRGHAGRCKGP
jgi:uncharacterized protein (TIGR00255 family)